MPGDDALGVTRQGRCENRGGGCFACIGCEVWVWCLEGDTGGECGYVAAQRRKAAASRRGAVRVFCVALWA